MFKKNKAIRTNAVFVPGGFPTVTYNPRRTHGLEDKVREASDNLSKLLVITGPTKSGKTVLVDKIFPRSESVWVDCGSVSDEKTFWELVIEQLNGFTDIEYQDSDSSSTEVGADGGVEGNIAILKGKTGAHTSQTKQVEKKTIKRRSISSKIKAIRIMQENQIPLIVDDFHYLHKDIQKSVVRAVKSPIMHGLPVIFIAIPNRKYDTVEVEREMTGRISTISMPLWEVSELKEIATTGFSALHIAVSNSIIDTLAREAYGSPFLMQEFCNTICKELDIKERCKETLKVPTDFNLERSFKKLAEDSGRPMFDKLRRGPRARKDRKQRTLKDGRTTDIYGVVMETLKCLEPGVESIKYENLRNNVRLILDETPPQKNEITRVLDKIAEIAYTDSSSTPVIDWQKEDNMLIVTDPFFAFYLKWAK